MAHLFFDDSKHYDSGFTLIACVICSDDPQASLSELIAMHGFDHDTFEFKSHAQMKGNPNLQNLRRSLRIWLRDYCKVAVCIVGDVKNMGDASLTLLERTLRHSSLDGQQHKAFFDQGFFTSRASAEAIIQQRRALERVHFNTEQDSRKVRGIQVADLAAHTCGVMLKEAMAKNKKMVHIPEYDYGNGTELEFELWATLRYSYLSAEHENDEDMFEFATVSVEPHGLHLHHDLSEDVKLAGRARFGSMYLGCIH